MDIAALRDLGFGHITESGVVTRACTAGPDKHGGLVFAASGFDSAIVGYFPESQTWEGVPGSEVWIGYYTARRPGPAELERKKLFGGHLVNLSDGQKWLFPVARKMNGTTPLPKGYRHDGQAWVAEEVKEQYRKLYENACALWNVIFEENTDGVRQLSVSEGLDIAVSALALNYRVGAHEVSALRLLDSDCMHDAFFAIVDYPSMVEFLKKKEESDMLNGEHGNLE